MKNTQIKNQEETEKFAIEIAKNIKPGDVIGMVGDLGAGKTTLTKYIARALGIEERITSPTFTIVHEYESGRLPLYHFDVYRLGGSEEMINIGYEEYFYGQGVTIVEWANLVMDIMPKESKIIEIAYGETEEGRTYRWNF